jgi:hypothetical protein
MRNHTCLKHRGTAVLALAIGALLPATVVAQTTDSGNWQYGTTVYGYLPTIGGKTSFPVDSGGTNLNVTPDKIIGNLKFVFMGSFDAHNGRWGAFTDILYMDIGGNKSQTRDFGIGNIGIPADTTANLDLDIKATVWTLAAERRVSVDPALTVDVLAGARLVDLKQRLRWSISGSLGPIAVTGRSGSTEVSENLWDAIIGVKGRFAFGENRKWSAPFYLDVGTGQSDRTWQAAVGIGYTFSWGEISALWRYLDYKFKSGRQIEEMNLNGPMIGATFRW